MSSRTLSTELAGTQKVTPRHWGGPVVGGF